MIRDLVQQSARFQQLGRPCTSRIVVSRLQSVVVVALLLVLGLAACGSAATVAPRPREANPVAATGTSRIAGPRFAALPVSYRGRTLSVPILMYHYIRVNPIATDLLGFRLSVTPANFKMQMDYLQQLGANTITPSQLLAALDGKASLPAHPVMLTFDDGYDNFATVATPILIAHHFVGVDYVVSGFLGRSGYMTAEQVKQVDAAGMVIGAHTVSHVALAKLPIPAAWAQIEGSKVQLEQLLGHPVTDFAYPYGSLSAPVITLVAKAGFRDAVTTQMGTLQSAVSPYTLERARVEGTDTVQSVAGKALLPFRSTPFIVQPGAPIPGSGLVQQSDADASASDDGPTVPPVGMSAIDLQIIYDDLTEVLDIILG